MLVIRGTAGYPGFTLDTDITVRNETVAIVGDNGTGKTTLLKIAAGLQRLSCGVVRLDGDVLDDPQTDTFVEPHRRHVSLLFQDPLLFSHLSVVDNVAFGLRRAGWDRQRARDRSLIELEKLGAKHLASRRPDTLSGGQAQRVALARALVRDPKMILLDEPFSSLDRTSRKEFREMLKESFGSLSIPRLIVTHDDADIAVLCQREITLERAEPNEGTAKAPAPVERTTGFEPATLTLAR